MLSRVLIWSGREDLNLFEPTVEQGSPGSVSVKTAMPIDTVGASVSRALLANFWVLVVEKTEASMYLHCTKQGQPVGRLDSVSRYGFVAAGSLVTISQEIRTGKEDRLSRRVSIGT